MKMLITLGITLMSVSAWAQVGNIRGVIEYRVKPDRATEFVDLQKQFAAELKKAGAARSRYVFQLMSGPRAYVAVTYYTKWAELDETLPSSPGISALVLRMSSCVESQSRRFDVIDPSLGIQNPAMPNFVYVSRVSVRPDKVNDYLALAKNTTSPAYKKAGVKRRTFARVRLGGASSDFVSSVGMDKWAELDGESALQKGLGADGYAALQAKLQPMIYQLSTDVYRYMPDASYVKEAGSSSGGR